MRTTKKPESTAAYKNPKVITTISVILALLALVWVVRSLRAERQKAEIRDLREQAFGEKARELSWEERGEKFKEYAEAQDRLPKDMKDELERERDREFAKREKERLDKFFKAPKGEQDAMLDKMIKDWEDRRNRGGGGFGGGGPPGGGFGGGGFGGGGSRGRGSAEDRENRAKARLDNGTPELRAQRAEFFQRLADRRKELGLPANPWGGAGGGGAPKGGAPKGGATKGGV